MASINVKIYPHEKDQMVAIIKKNQGKTMSVANLAKLIGFNPNRSRFIIEELIEEGRIRRVPTKSYNPRYIRYAYEVI